MCEFSVRAGCNIKQLLDEVFVICRIINVEADMQVLASQLLFLANRNAGQAFRHYSGQSIA